MITRMFRRNVEQVIARLFLGTGGHTHSGVNGDGPKIPHGSISTTLADWVPVIKQGGAALSHTLRYAKYTGLGTYGFVWMHATLTEAGTAGNRISITGMPTILTPAFATNSPCIGHFKGSDAGTQVYAGIVIPVTALDWSFQVDAGTDALGVNPAWTLANNDELSFVCIYPLA